METATGSVTRRAYGTGRRPDVAAGTVAGVDEPVTAPVEGSQRPSLTVPAVIVVVAIALDQLTKWWALQELEDGDVVEDVPGFTGA